MARVKAEGDQALFDYTARFDGVKLDGGTVLVTEKEVEGSLQRGGSRSAAGNAKGAGLISVPSMKNSAGTDGLIQTPPEKSWDSG